MASALAALVVWTLVIVIGVRAKRRLARARASTVSGNPTDRTHGKGPGWDQDYPWALVDGVLDDLDEEG